MLPRIKTTFLLLVLTQALHSVEEYTGKLWEVFPPASFICNLIAKNPGTGFLILDVTLILFGFFCWQFCFRKNYIAAQGLLWIWIVMETINGLGHISWAISSKAYVAGVATAPVLFIIAIYLAKQIVRYNARLLEEKKQEIKNIEDSI